jgi:LppX_LprAFG lipoprotein
MSPAIPSRPARRAVAAFALVALATAACGGPAATPLTDPAEILQKGAASLGAMTSLHLRGAVGGEFPISIGGAGGGAPVPLDGTTLDGDIDVANGELAVELLAPALVNLRVNLVVADGATYLKAPLLTGDTWLRQPSAGGIGDPGAAIDGLATFLARPELKPELLADTRCGGVDCYSVRFTVPASEVRDALGSLGSAIPGLSGDAVGDVTVTAGVRKDNLQLATLGLDIPTGGQQPLTIDLELSKVNEPVTITPPPADQVKDAPGG